MHTADISSALGALLAELVDGASKEGGYMLNPGDEGLLRSLEKLSAGDASARTATGSSIAAHVDHVRYGLSLMNRWSKGEHPFESADWKTSWTRTQVSETEWRQRIADLRAEAARWLDVVRTPRDVDEDGLKGLVGSIAHLAYHLGAIRQISQTARGPKEGVGEGENRK
jgi:hypothetical protein